MLATASYLCLCWHLVFLLATALLFMLTSNSLNLPKATALLWEAGRGNVIIEKDETTCFQHPQRSVRVWKPKMTEVQRWWSWILKEMTEVWKSSNDQRSKDGRSTGVQTLGSYKNHRWQRSKPWDSAISEDQSVWRWSSDRSMGRGDPPILGATEDMIMIITK